MDKYIEAVKGFFDRINDSYILNPTKKMIVTAFCVITAVVCAVSGILVIGEVVGDDTATTAESSTEDIIAFVPIEDDVPIKANLLFALEGNEKLELLGVIRLDSAEKAIRVSLIDSDTYCSFNNFIHNMLTIYFGR